MPLLHFHVDQHDVGYMPDPDNVATHQAVDSAVDDLISRAEDWLDHVAQTVEADPEAITRGQPFATEPHTFVDEENAVNSEIEEIQENLRTNDDFTVDVAKSGYLMVLEDGISVIELTPCAETTCEDYYDEWVT